MHGWIAAADVIRITSAEWQRKLCQPFRCILAEPACFPSECHLFEQYATSHSQNHVTLPAIKMQSQLIILDASTESHDIGGSL
jgi:hypothetical protein